MLDSAALLATLTSAGLPYLDAAVCAVDIVHTVPRAVASEIAEACRGRLPDAVNDRTVWTAVPGFDAVVQREAPHHTVVRVAAVIAAYGGITWH